MISVNLSEVYDGSDGRILREGRAFRPIVAQIRQR
jgi:hypothetical protein